MNEEQLAYWNTYLDSLPGGDPGYYVEASIAGSEAIADQLLQLYLDGKKTAGSGLVKDYEMAGDDLPKVDNHWIILDANEKPRCIVKTTRVEFHRFDQVPLEVALAEGEGDLSLEYWKNSHREFFTPYLKGLGLSDLESAQIVTEFYDLVFRSL